MKKADSRVGPKPSQLITNQIAEQVDNIDASALKDLIRAAVTHNLSAGTKR